MRMTSIVATLLATLFMAGQVEKARAGLFISITVAPPVLPVYVQPPIPGPGYMWTPGYWAWDDDGGDYYWVPGAWVAAPEPGFLWTPGYWGWSNGVYAWNAGYWGPHIGFYGGVSYGFGYTGVGFAGGAWVGGVFSYNRACTNIGGGVNITNVYSKTVIVSNTTNVSFNGGNGGIRAQPNAQELAAANEHHVQPTGDQLKHQQLASKNPDLKFAKNRGRPSIAATSRAGDFSKGNTFAAKSAGGPFKPASFNPNAAGNQTRRTDDHKDKKNNFIPPKGANLSKQNRKPNPPPGQRPANKRPPNKDQNHP
jgi:WXXGXW repeat (2 copies)